MPRIFPCPGKSKALVFTFGSAPNPLAKGPAHGRLVRCYFNLLFRITRAEYNQKMKHNIHAKYCTLGIIPQVPTRDNTKIVGRLGGKGTLPGR